MIFEKYCYFFKAQRSGAVSEVKPLFTIDVNHKVKMLILSITMVLYFPFEVYKISYNFHHYKLLTCNVPLTPVYMLQ